MNTIRQHVIAATLALSAYVFLPANAGAATLTISGCDSLAVVSTTEVSCNAAQPAPGAPTGCTASASPTNLPATGGGSVTLTGQCSGGAAVASTTWTRNGTSVTAPDTTVPSNAQGTSSFAYTYTARFCATGGTSCTNAFTQAVTVAAGASLPAGAGAIPAKCDRAGVILSTIQPFMEGNTQQRILTFTGARFLTSGFAGNTTNVVVGRIDVPLGASGTSSLTVFEYGSVKTTRRMWLSKDPCDFSGTGPYNPLPASGPTAHIKIGGTNDSTRVMMQPGEIWFVKVLNEMSATGKQNSCSTGTCDIGIKLAVPQ